MSRMFVSHTRFMTGITELKALMNGMESINLLNQIDLQQVEVNLLDNNFKTIISNIINAHKDVDKRKYDYITTIITLYGLLEDFVESVVKEYLIKLSNIFDEYINFPDNIRELHIELSIELIKNIHQSQYANIVSKEDVIKNLYLCIEENKCKLNTWAYSHHNANFRLDEIKTVLKRIGIDSFTNKVRNDSGFKDYFLATSPYSISAYPHLMETQIFEYLEDLINRRNEIAHGNISNRLEHNLLKMYMDFIETFVITSNNILVKELLKYHIDSGLAIKINPINIHGKKILCFKLVNDSVCVNNILIGKRGDEILFSYIKSIGVGDKRYNKFSANEEVEIAVLLDFKVTKNMSYWLLHSF